MSRLSTERLIHLRNHPIFGWAAHRLLRYLSAAEVPSEVSFGPGLVVHHHAMGLVIHHRTTVGARVHLFQGVTIGRDRVWEPLDASSPFHIVIEDDVWVCTGATVLGGEDGLRIGRGTIIGANAVLRDSTGPWEIWAGIPARLVGTREPTVWTPRDGRRVDAD